MARKNVATKEEVSCMAHSDNLLFLGLADKLGIVVIATRKLIRMPHADGFKEISCLKVSEDQETLYMGTISNKLYVISISQVSKTIIKNCNSFKINNILEIPFNCLDNHEVPL
jgi:hypothetical protein